MYTQISRQSEVEWFAVGPDGLIVLSHNKLDRALDGLDLKEYLNVEAEKVKMTQFGLNLIFTDQSGNAVIYNLQNSELIFSTASNPIYFDAGFIDLKELGYIAVCCYKKEVLV